MSETVFSSRPSIRTIPPHVFFVVSAIFHYLGPAFAVLLFKHVDVLGVAWLRIGSAALVFLLWRRPWRVFIAADARERALLFGLGLVLGVMNASFYLAIEKLPLATVGAIEFMGPILLAAIGARTLRNIAALAAAVAGVYLITDVRWMGETLGFVLAFINCALFMLYIVIGHKIAGNGGASGVDRLAAAMLIAWMVVSPIGLREALPALSDWNLLAAGFGVGLCSSVIPYVCDQLAMARLPRATFSLLLALLPVTAVSIGVGVLGQIPSAMELLGILLVMIGVALHRASEAKA